MKERSKPKLTQYSQTLRKNMTKEERLLWYNFLKHLPVPVHRQQVIGSYLVDFYVHSAKLVIEVDGDQHGEEAGLAKDAVRDTWLRERGLTVLRYTNGDVTRSFESVCQDILQYIPEVNAEDLWIE